MSYTTIYVFAGVKRENLKTLLRHECRDLDRAEGKEVTHSNKLIRSHLTDLNATYTCDGKGGFRALGSVDEICDFVDDKIASARNFRENPKTGKRTPVKVREGDSVVTEFVLELDPEFTRDQSVSRREYELLGPAAFPADAETMSKEKMELTVKYLHAMRDKVIEQFGESNVAWISENWDESHPHIHMGIVNMTEDGQLSRQKVFHGGRGKKTQSQEFCRRLHDDMREHLRAQGYDARLDRTSEGKGVTLAEYKAEAERVRVERLKRAEAEAETAKVKARETGYAEGKEIALEGARKVSAKLSKREQVLDEREADLDARASAIRDAESEVETVRASALREAEKKRAEAEETARELTAKARADRQAAETLRSEAESKLREANEKLANASVGMSSEAAFRDLLKTMTKHPAFTDAAKEAALAMQQAVYPWNKPHGTKDAKNIDAYLRKRANDLKQRREADMRAVQQATTFETGKGAYDGLGG